MFRGPVRSARSVSSLAGEGQAQNLARVFCA